MATKEQYEFFARLFDEEAKRSSVLTDRAKWYLSLTALYSAIITFVAEKLKPVNELQLWIFLASDAGMLASFLVSLWAVRIATFEAITAPSLAVEQLLATDFDETKFYLDRISDFSVATERNERVNDRQASSLAIASYLMLIGMVAHGWYFYEKFSEGAHSDKRAAQIAPRAAVPKAP